MARAGSNPDNPTRWRKLLLATLACTDDPEGRAKSLVSALMAADESLRCLGKREEAAPRKSGATAAGGVIGRIGLSEEKAR